MSDVPTLNDPCICVDTRPGSYAARFARQGR